MHTTALSIANNGTYNNKGWHLQLTGAILLCCHTYPFIIFGINTRRQ